LSSSPVGAAASVLMSRLYEPVVATPVLRTRTK